MKPVLEKMDKWFQEKVKGLGVDFFPINWEVVPEEVLLEVMSYGLPTKFRHWSHGQSYQYQKLQGEMGLSKVYELIINSNPSYAFLLETNSDIANIMVIAHCLHPDTSVFTLSGVKKISEVQSGDEVFTHNGNIKKVKWCSETKKTKEIIEIKLKGIDEKIYSTPEHKFYVETEIGPSWVEAKDILLEDKFIYPKLNICETSVEELIIPINSTFSKSDRRWKKELSAKEDGFKIKLNHNFGRLLGLYIAEGYKSNTSSHFCFHSKEKEYHQAVSDIMKEINENIKTSLIVRERNHSAVVSFSEENISNWLEKECGKGCENKKIPEFIFKNNVPPDFIKGLIRGLFEGDGSILDYSRTAYYSTTSPLLASQIKLLLNDVGISSTLNIRHRKDSVKNSRKVAYEVLTHGTDRRAVLDICDILDNCVPKRTWSFYNKKERYNVGNIISIRKIELENEIGVWDMEVEDDHSFMLASGAIAHNCYFHSAFFKNNYLFKQTDRQMVYHAAERAQRIDDYINQYGLEKVEHFLDIALAMDKNIDWHRGLNRKAYPSKKKILKEKKTGEFDDLYGKSTGGFEEVVVNSNFPPQKEYDLLWFFANYAELEPWQKDIFEIVREEAYYFYPQYMTKIMNEGFASYGHAEMMYLLSNEMLSHADYLEYVKIHERVVQPGGSKLDINPYFLGFTILNDIKNKWDEKYKNGESDINGFQKMLRVVEEEDDISFLRTYLTQEIVNDLQMFTYKTYYDRNKNQYIEIASTDVKDVVEGQISQIYNYRAPLIYIEKAGPNGIEMVHESTPIGTLDPKHIEKVLEYIQEIWGGVIDLKTTDENGEFIHYTQDEEGFSHSTM